MPKLGTGKTPKYRRHRASGQAVVTIAGVDRYLGPWKSKASNVEYDRLVGEWLAAGRPSHSTTPASGDDYTIADLCLGYLRFAERHYVKNGRVTDEAACVKAALRYLRASYGHTLAADFGPLALQSLQARMVDAGLTRGVINQNAGRIRRAFRWAVANEKIAVTVWQALLAVSGLQKGKTTAREPEPIGPVGESTIDATLPHLPPIVADMVRFQRYTGCRPSECCSVRPCDVDTSGEVWVYIPAEHKTEHRGKQRKIFVGPRGQDVLRPYLLRAPDAFCFVPAESEQKRNRRRRENRQSPMTPSQARRRPKRKPKKTAGQCYTSDSYRRAITRACDKSFLAEAGPVEWAKLLAMFQAGELGRRDQVRRDGEAKWRRAIMLAGDKPAGNVANDSATWFYRRAVERWRPNQLRHLAATQIRSKYGLEAAQVTLGHSKADVTQVYAERDAKLAERVAREVG